MERPTEVKQFISMAYAVPGYILGKGVPKESMSSREIFLEPGISIIAGCSHATHVTVLD